MADDESRLIAERRAKLKVLREKGVAYPNDFFRQNRAAELVEKYENVDRDTMDLDPVVVKVAGRIMLKRPMGKITFAQIQDMSGQIQVFVADNAPDKETHNAFKHRPLLWRVPPQRRRGPRGHSLQVERHRRCPRGRQSW